MADQLIGQCIRGRQRSGFCQSGDIFQQTFDLFANNVWIRQTLQNIELNFANRIELNETLASLKPFGKRDQQIGNTGRGGKHDQTYARIGKDHVRTVVHCIKICHAGTAEFGDDERGNGVTHCYNLVSGKPGV